MIASGSLPTDAQPQVRLVGDCVRALAQALAKGELVACARWLDDCARLQGTARVDQILEEFLRTRNSSQLDVLAVAALDHVPVFEALRRAGWHASLWCDRLSPGGLVFAAIAQHRLVPDGEVPPSPPNLAGKVSLAFEAGASDADALKAIATKIVALTRVVGVRRQQDLLQAMDVVLEAGLRVAGRAALRVEIGRAVVELLTFGVGQAPFGGPTGARAIAQRDALVARALDRLLPRMTAVQLRGLVANQVLRSSSTKASAEVAWLARWHLERIERHGHHAEPVARARLAHRMQAVIDGMLRAFDVSPGCRHPGLLALARNLQAQLQARLIANSARQQAKEAGRVAPQRAPRMRTSDDL